MDNINLVAETVSQLAQLGITAGKNPTDYCAYQGAFGSISNHTVVQIGRIRQMHAPNGESMLGVFVQIDKLSEAGEDFSDFSSSEARNVPLLTLIDYLAGRGIRTPKRENKVCRVYTDKEMDALLEVRVARMFSGGAE